MKTLRKIMLVCMCLLLPASGALAATLSLPDPLTVPINQQFSVDVTVNDTTQLCGAAFVVNYDPTYLQVVDITSTFFPVFQTQFTTMLTAAGETACTTCPTSVTVDGVTYTQPLVDNNSTTGTNIGTMLAAARVVPESTPTTNTKIFTVVFQATAAAESGSSYDIAIKPTYLSNADAGYTTPQYINLLVGYDETQTAVADQFPPLLAATADGSALVTTTVTFSDVVWTLDIDGNGTVQANKDGFLLMRYLYNSRGTALINGVVGTGATRTTSAEIEAYIAEAITGLIVDVDGNGSVQANKDGFLIMRYLYNSRGTALINGVVGTGATRTTAAEIEAYIASLL